MVLYIVSTLHMSSIYTKGWSISHTIQHSTHTSLFGICRGIDVRLKFTSLSIYVYHVQLLKHYIEKNQKSKTTNLILMMLLTMCSVSGATNWSGRQWSRQNFTATASAESPSFISMCSTHPSSISTVMANNTLRSSDSFSV